jgi:hypothetical protein
VTAALAFLGLIGVLLIPAASGATTVQQRLARIGGRVTTTTTAVAGEAAAPADAPPADAAAADAAPQPVIADATVPGFTFPPFTFGTLTFPGFTLPPINIPDFPGSGNLVTFIQNIFAGIQNLLCSLLGSSFCASP